MSHPEKKRPVTTIVIQILDAYIKALEICIVHVWIEPDRYQLLETITFVLCIIYIVYVLNMYAVAVNKVLNLGLCI